jgi:hypothetical protein
MTGSTTYTVGRGKPPAHSRFKKGQSGNPGGKPGPAKLAKNLFRHHLYQALCKPRERLLLSSPSTALEHMANRLVANATWGEPAPVRLLLSLLDAEIAEDEKADQVPHDTDCERREAETRSASAAPERNETAPSSLPQGKSQGKENAPAGEASVSTGANGPRARTDETVRKQDAIDPANTPTERNEVAPVSLPQGKSQGKENAPAEEASVSAGANGPRAPTDEAVCKQDAIDPANTPTERNEAAPVSLPQGKSQGAISKNGGDANRPECGHETEPDAGGTLPPPPGTNKAAESPTIRLGTPAFRS